MYTKTLFFGKILNCSYKNQKSFLFQFTYDFTITSNINQTKFMSKVFMDNQIQDKIDRRIENLYYYVERMKDFTMLRKSILFRFINCNNGICNQSKKPSKQKYGNNYGQCFDSFLWTIFNSFCSICNITWSVPNFPDD